MSDIIRGAQHTIIIAGSGRPEEPADLKNPNALTEVEQNTLQQWGRRVWTIPEVILARGETVTVIINGAKPRSFDKVLFAQQAWNDADESRQLVENYTTVHLSRLELVNIAWKCLKNRELKEMWPGDRSYALVGLLRLRPKIDNRDTSFQAFAR